MKKNIFLVDNGTDLDTLINEIKFFSEYSIFTLDYSIHRKLEKAKRYLINGFE